MVLSSGIIKLINSLKLKKYRDLNALFSAEGEKIIIDLIASGLRVKHLILIEGSYRQELETIKERIIYVDEKNIKKISNLKTIPQAVAVFEIPEFNIDKASCQNELVLYCDGIQDPGNFGTIVRTCDWFGINKIFCSPNTVDVFNSKVIQASMGSVGRVGVHYLNPDVFFKPLDRNIPIYGTFLEGESIYESRLSESGVIVIGNEGSGITKETSRFINRKLFIPGFSNAVSKPESLNASVACGIVCSEFRRRKI
jgi:TrmH family RNA methyltransferase